MRKLTYEFVKEQFEKEGYELLSKEYKNSKIKLDYRCPNGHKHSICWSKWQQNCRCPYCDGQGKPTIEFIRSEFAKGGYILLTKEYINNRQKLEYVCPKGHKHSIGWDNWQQGYRCPYCVGLGKPSIKFIKSEFAKEDYELLTTEYKNCYQKLEYICSRGHKHSVSWTNWVSGRRCPCFANRPPIDINFIEREFAKEGYKLLSKKYKNAYQKLEYICPKGHGHSIIWHSWQQGHRCPYCINIISKGEIQIRSFIRSLNIEISSNNRDQIFNPFTNYPLELDIFMPTLNKAIEYNGEYWHQDENRDLFKQGLCKSKNIDLLIIWENEWKTKRDVCEGKIKNFVFNSEGGT